MPRKPSTWALVPIRLQVVNFKEALLNMACLLRSKPPPRMVPIPKLMLSNRAVKATNTRKATEADNLNNKDNSNLPMEVIKLRTKATALALLNRGPVLLA